MSPRVALVTLGGTISMTKGADNPGIVPTLGAKELAASLPDLGEVEVELHSLERVPSASLTTEVLLQVLAECRAAVHAGASGVVITQGTDTIDETSYFFDLLWDLPAPLIVTGAMRSPDEPGSDGPANMRDAILVAAEPAVREMGVLVVMAGEIHLARTVEKSHTSSICAFASPGEGPVGHVVEGQLRLHYRPVEVFPSLPEPKGVFVPLIEAVLDDDGQLIEAALAGGAVALVVAGSGAGHVSYGTRDRLAAALDRGIPVILTSRTGSGSVLTRTYGYRGAEIDLLSLGVIPAGFLSGRKARLLARVVLGSGGSVEDLRREVLARGA
ncbi:asparaginase [Actinomyces sp. F1_1611]